MKILNYEKWNKRKILVLKMITSSFMLESYLESVGIPTETIDCNEDIDIEAQFKKLKDSICGVVISGSLTTKKYNEYPRFPLDILENVPVLGICYGHELLCEVLESTIVDCNPPMGEHSVVSATLIKNPLFEGIDVSKPTIVTMNHDEMVENLPNGATLIAHTKLTPVAGFYHPEKMWWGIQFHPEKDWLGDIIFKNFYEICRS